MGLCASGPAAEEDTPAKANSRALEQLLSTQQAADMQVTKLLLLGAGESGKSSMFKQMMILYGTGIPTKERLTHVPIVRSNVITNIKVLVENSERFGPIAPHLHDATETIKVAADLTPENAPLVAQLWKDPGIQQTYQHRAKFQIFSSAAYFFDKIDVVANPDYIPTEDDVIRTRVRTTGIVENSFLIDGFHFRMFDVGGQRTERKKWIHCFENVTAVLFVAALSEYDQVLYEDEETNRMVEALDLFQQICNSPWFQKTSMILFLNKKDLFEEKLPQVPLTVCSAFSSYAGDGSFADATSYIGQVFSSLSEDPTKRIYTHVTCATDPRNMQVVFKSVKDIVIRYTLRDAGLS